MRYTNPRTQSLAHSICISAAAVRDAAKKEKAATARVAQISTESTLALRGGEISHRVSVSYVFEGEVPSVL